MVRQVPALPARLPARAAFVTVGVVALTLAFAPHAPRFLPWDKAEHFLGGAVIALLALPAMPGLALGWLISGLAVSAALVEVIQATPQVGRSGDPADWLAGVLGAVLAIALCRLTLRLQPRLRR